MAERLDAGQRLALQPFEEGAARGRDVAEIVRHARVVQGGDGVAAAGDGEELARARALRRMLRRGDRGAVERLLLEGAERAVPDQRLRLVDPAR